MSNLPGEYTTFIDPTGKVETQPKTLFTHAGQLYATKVKPLVRPFLTVYICPTENMTPFFFPPEFPGGAAPNELRGLHRHPPTDSGQTGTANGGVQTADGSPVKMAHVTDGTSNTIMVGEIRSWDPVNFFRDAVSGTDFGNQARYFPFQLGAGAVATNGLDDWDSHFETGR